MTRVRSVPNRVRMKKKKYERVWKFVTVVREKSTVPVVQVKWIETRKTRS